MTTNQWPQGSLSLHSLGLQGLSRGHKARGDPKVSRLEVVLVLEAGVGETLLQQGVGGGLVMEASLHTRLHLDHGNLVLDQARLRRQREDSAGLTGNRVAGVGRVAGAELETGVRVVQQKVLLQLDLVLKLGELKQRLLEIDPRGHARGLHSLLEAGGHRVSGLGGHSPLRPRGWGVGGERGEAGARGGRHD